uniref:Uncharacterized protein n=1 Tax=Cacopsylla melanoneura TaxID=428564 RepID=A0A8D8SXS2_9HEMI
MTPALSLYSLLLFFSWWGHIKGFLFPPEDAPRDPNEDSVAPDVNSTEFLAKWLEDPVNQAIVAPVTGCVTGTIPERMHTNSPYAEDWIKYNTNVSLTTVSYPYIESKVRSRLESYFAPPDVVNLTFVKALFIPLTQPKLMYRLLVISDKFHKMPMFDRHNLTKSIVDKEVALHTDNYKHEQQCFVFTHDEWRRKKDNFMEVFSTLFYKIPRTAERVTFGPPMRRKRRGVTQPMLR